MRNILGYMEVLTLIIAIVIIGILILDRKEMKSFKTKLSLGVMFSWIVVMSVIFSYYVDVLWADGDSGWKIYEWILGIDNQWIVGSIHFVGMFVIALVAFTVMYLYDLMAKYEKKEWEEYDRKMGIEEKKEEQETEIDKKDITEK